MKLATAFRLLICRFRGHDYALWSSKPGRWNRRRPKIGTGYHYRCDRCGRARA